jgi:hypothetical protein
MRGTITGKDVFLHSLTIVRLFGVSSFLACAWAAITGRPDTFLGVLYPSPLAGSDPARRGPPVAPPRWRESR